MDLRFLDKDFQHSADTIDIYSSFIWIEKWYETGGFDLVLSYDKFDIVSKSQYIYNRDEDKTALITQIDITNDSLIVNGKMLEYIMSWRVIDSEVAYNDTIENVIYAAVQKFAMTGNRTIPKLTLAEQYGFSERYEGITEEGKTLEQWLYDILRPFDMSFRVRYDYDNDILIFSVVKGLDRTQEQGINPKAIFSTGFENITDMTYTTSNQDYRNYAYVVGEYDGNRIIETVDQTNGEERRELYINASISSDETEFAPQYRNVLRQRGIEALAEYRNTETVSCKILEQGSLVYGIDYNIGDICEVTLNEIGIVVSKQITEVETVYDTDGKQVYPRFGEDTLTDFQYIERELKK